MEGRGGFLIKSKIKYRGHTFFKDKDGYYRNGQTTLHRYKYEQKYGMILPGFQLHHKDGNKFNNKLNNLVMLTLREHIEVHKLMRREMVFKDQLVLM